MTRLWESLRAEVMVHRQQRTLCPSEASISRAPETNEAVPKRTYTPRREPDHYWRHRLPDGVQLDEKDRRLGKMLAWCISSCGHVVNVPDPDVDSYGLTFHLDRLIVMARADQTVRHKNGDLLDCRRANLIVERA